ncbi:MAG: hypothetical protein OEW64_11630 [Gammaproteobacteria bacterium]|nr:hypothetical protein [Gammaproteobacteria bacterium]MDH5304729.1 hypothetical protein [Gammaproteobacteria bacterium]MDH5321176.1 hypothetical protein [Gammaproteobacteria bacterium]
MPTENRNPNLDRAGLLTSPDYFFWGYKGSIAYFVNMNRGLYYKSIFCDGRIYPRNNEVITMPLAQLLDRFEEENFPAPKLNYIFHMAHGGSTLLSRALDLPGVNIVYREPAALRQLGVAAAEEQFGDQPTDIWQRVLRLSTVLLAKTYQQNERVVIKANVPVNFIIPQLMAVNAHTRGLILFERLDDYLLSVLKSQGHRDWLQNVVDELRNSIDALLGLPAGAKNKLSDAEAAAALWMTQVHLFAKALQKYPNLRSLDSEHFYSKPKLVLSKACEFFRFRVKEQKLDAIVAGDLFQRYSKNPEQEFSNTLRLQKKDQLRTEIGAELRAANDWVQHHVDCCPVPKCLTRPLTAQLTKLLA